MQLRAHLARAARSARTLAQMASDPPYRNILGLRDSCDLVCDLLDDALTDLETLERAGEREPVGAGAR